MQHNNTAAHTNRLIAVAKEAVNAVDRDRAMYELWEIHGDRLVGSMAKTSYKIDSDFGYRGYTPQERRDNQAGNAYFVFHEAVMEFDASKRVPFAAYIAQKGNWRVADEKRENARHSMHEECVDFSQENGEIADTSAMPFDEEILWKDSVRSIYRATEQDSRLHRYFGTCMELLDDGSDYSDAEIARRMGCTRANVGVYKKKLIRLITEEGLLEDIVPRRAA